MATRLYLTAMSVLIAVGHLVNTPAARADTVRAECGFSHSPDDRPEQTSSCMFSQRQGYISIRIDGGTELELAPFGDQAGNYRDQDNKPVYRQRGLGDQGQLFKLPDTYLFVLWNPGQLECDKKNLTAPDMCLLSYRGLGFELQATADSSINQLRLNAVGLSNDRGELTAELDGVAYRAELADLDSNGWPEVYVYVASAGSGSYGSLVAFAVNNGKSATPIYLPPLESSPEATEGYMGHDRFAVVENRLVRRFPVYREGDTNAEPSGGTRQLQYRLEAGEAGWLLVVDRVVDY
jgi:hypothetical protein